MILVNVRCSRCRRVLKRFASIPPGDVFEIARCPACDMPSFHRFSDFIIGKGGTRYALTLEVPVALIRDAADVARRRGKTADVAVNPIPRDDPGGLIV